MPAGPRPYPSTRCPGRWGLLRPSSLPLASRSWPSSQTCELKTDLPHLTPRPDRVRVLDPPAGRRNGLRHLHRFVTEGDRAELMWQYRPGRDIHHRHHPLRRRLRTFKLRSVSPSLLIRVRDTLCGADAAVNNSYSARHITNSLGRDHICKLLQNAVALDGAMRPNLAMVWLT